MALIGVKRCQIYNVTVVEKCSQKSFQKIIVYTGAEQVFRTNSETCILEHDMTLKVMTTAI
jgi:hypothetical protein